MHSRTLCRAAVSAATATARHSGTRYGAFATTGIVASAASAAAATARRCCRRRYSAMAVNDGTSNLPLDGYRVLDMTRVLAGVSALLGVVWIGKLVRGGTFGSCRRSAEKLDRWESKVIGSERLLT